MKTKLFAGSMAVALLAGGWVAFNAHAADNTATTEATPQRMHGRLLERAKTKLGVTDEQAVQIKAQLKSEKSNLTGLLTRLQDARTDLRHAIQAGDATEDSVRAAAAKVSTVESDMAVERLKLHGKIAPILTSDQQKKLVEMETHLDEVVDLLINRMNNRLSR